MPRPVLLRRPTRLATAAVTGAVAVALLGPVTAAGPGAAAAPAERRADACAEPFPVADLVRGDDVTGSTVTAGTTPTGFTGEVLGVLDDGIAPDVDMVMVELDMPEFARTAGVWQGMSGSPVYAADGRLIGAVAYGLSNGPSRVAGVTPYAAMLDEAADDAAPGAAVRSSRVAVDAATARLLAARAGITRAEAQQGFATLRMPLGVAGVPQRLLSEARSSRSPLKPQASYVLGRSSGPRAAGPETLVAGGNLAASVSYGDITMAGVGTVTSVCDDHLLAFGHPMLELGRTTLGLHPADAVYIQPDSLGSPFKVANIGAVSGTVVGDRLTGLSAYAGQAPDAVTVTSTVTRGDRTRTGSTEVLVPEAVAEVTLYQVATNVLRVVPDVTYANVEQTYTVRGTENGKAFRLSYRQRYSSPDYLEEAAFSAAILTGTITELRGVVISSVDISTTVENTRATSRVRSVQQLRRGQWVPVGARKPAQARAGSTLQLRVVLGGADAGLVLPVPAFKIPRRAAGVAFLQVAGGASSGFGGFGGFEDDEGYGYGPTTLAQLREQLRSTPAGDEVGLVLGSTPSSGEGEGEGGEDGFIVTEASARKKPFTFSATRTVGPVGHVVAGGTQAPVQVLPVKGKPRG